MRQRDMCFEMCFFRRLQRHNAATSFFYTLTFTNTLTHSCTHEEADKWFQIFRVLQIIFDHMWSARVFWTARGSRNIRKYFQSVINVFSCLCIYYFLMQALCCNKITLGKLLICKAQLLEINRAPTAG